MANLVEIIIRAKDETKGVLGGIGGALGGLAKFAGGAAIAGVGAGVTAIGGAFVFAAKEAMAAQEIVAQTAAVLESTGGAAGMTAEEIANLASELSGVTRFSDDAIQSGENMLLTFTNIGEDVFPEATKAILDMSTATGQDLQSSAVQLGKALNDPIAGISALSRVGVTFTDDQKKMIESMVEAGDVAGAQTVILQELQKEFGGSAEAAGGTLAGQMDILKNSLSNVAETAGTALLPILTQGLQALTPHITALAQGLSNFLQSEGFRKFLTDVGTFITEKVIPAVQAIFKWLGEVLPPIIAALAAWWRNTLLPALQEFGNFVETKVIPVLKTIWDWLATNLPPVIAALAKFWNETLLPAFQAFADFIKTYVIPVLQDIFKWLGEHIPPVIDALAKFWNEKLKPAFDAFVAFQKTVTIPILKEIVGWFKEHIPKAIETVKRFINGLKTTFNNVKTAIQNVIDKVKAFIDKLKGIKDKLPDWLVPGSPTPFEIGLTGIAEQMNALASKSVPNLARSLAGIKPVDLVGNAGLTAANGDGGLTSLASPGMAGGGMGGVTVVYSPVFSAASMKEFEQQLVPLIDRQLSLNQRRRVERR